MANEIDDIVQNVVLTGDSDIVAAFDRIREAGEHAFESLSRAIEESVFSFTGLATAVAGVVASIGIVGVGMFEFVKSTEEGVSSLSDLATQAGTTTEEISGIKAAFASGGVASGELATAFRRLSVSIQQSWTEIRQASRQSADQLKGDSLAVQSAEIALSDAQQKSANVGRDAALTRRQNILSVADAQQRLDELNAKDLASKGVDTSQLDQVLAQQRQLNELRQAEQALLEAKKKRADDAANADNEAAKAAIAAEQAVLALNAARRKEEDDLKNDINNVTAAVKKVAEGDSDALKNINGTAENIAKGIINSVGEAAKSLTGLKGDISDLASPAPGVKDTFLQIGKVLANIEDPALRTATAVRLLGRTVNQEFLNVLADPEKIDAFIKRVNDLKIGVSEADEEISQKFRAALFGFQNDLQLVGNKVASAFGPGFTTILKTLDDTLINNRQSIIDFAESISSAAVPVVESFIRVLTGAAEPRDQWLVNYIEKIKSFGAGLGELLSIVGKVFSAIGTAASEAADSLNSVFGTSLNGVDVAFGVWAAAIIARIGLVQKAVEAAALIIGVLLTEAFAPLALAIAGLYALAKAFDAVRDFFGLGTADKSSAMLQGAQDRLKAIAELLSGDIKKGVEDFIKAGEDQNTREKELEKTYKEVTDSRKQQTAEALTVEKNANVEAVASHKTARQQINDDSKQSADKRIDDVHRVADAEKDAAQDAKNSASDAAKAAQTAVTTTTTAAAVNGQKLIDRGGTVNVTPGATQAQISDALNRQEQSLLSEIKKPLVTVDQAIEAMHAQGGENNLKAPQPILDPEEVADATEKLRQFGNRLAEVDPRASDIIKLLSDRSDGTLPGQAPKTQGELDRMVENQKQITEVERETQKLFSESMQKQLGTKPSPPQAVGIDGLPANAIRTGHYDSSGQFVQDKVIPGSPSGAPQPLNFPDYKQLLKDTVFPQGGVPLPTPRPGDLAYQQQQKTMTDAVRDGVEAAEKDTAKPFQPAVQRPESLTPAFQPPGEFPKPPEQVPLSPDLVPPGHPIAELGDALSSAFDGFKSGLSEAKDAAVSFAEKIKENQVPLTQSPENNSSLVQSLGSIFDQVLQNIQQHLATPPGDFQQQQQQQQQQTPEVPTEELSKLGDEATTTADDLESVNTLVTDFGTTLQSTGGSATSLQTALESAAAAATAFANAASSAAASSAASAPRPVTAAFGGWIRGPGGTTGDKIPALVSDEEYIHKAASTRFWSVPFMHAVNNMDVAGVLDHLSKINLPKFSTGGLVGLMSPQLPRFREGGVVSTSPANELRHLGTVDLTTDHGPVRVAVDRGSLNQLRRAAVLKNVGRERQPSWAG